MIFILKQKALPHKGGSYIYGINLSKIESLCKVEDKFELAIGIAAGNKINAFVVENDYVAEECINFLRRNKISFKK